VTRPVLDEQALELREVRIGAEERCAHVSAIYRTVAAEGRTERSAGKMPLYTLVGLAYGSIKTAVSANDPWNRSPGESEGQRSLGADAR
jgi:hypothetical protein